VFQKYLIFIFLLALTSLSKEVSACGTDCVIENTWAIGVGVGLGEHSNPLYDGKDRNVAVLPSFYYYGESFYIENTEIGYVLEADERWVISLKGKFNNDGLYFNESNFSGILASGLQSPGNFGDPETVAAGEVNRDYSYLAGLSSKYFLNDNISFSLAAYHDITNVHNGYSITAGSQFTWSKKRWRFQASFGVEFSDSDLNSYYFGLREEDGTSYANFEIGSSSNISASTSFAYRLNKNFSLIGRYSYQWLDSSITKSPLVEDAHTRMFFIGISGQYGSN